MDIGMKKDVLLYEGKRSLFSILGALLYAAGINLFMVPSGLYTGGLMGICQVIRTVLAEIKHHIYIKQEKAGAVQRQIHQQGHLSHTEIPLPLGQQRKGHYQVVRPGGIYL